MRLNLRATPEVIVLTAMLILSVLGIIFMNALVAAPKLLFGRSLTALDPGLFPTIVLSLLALLCGAALFRLNRSVALQADAGVTRDEWVRGIVLFAIMIWYCLTMEPFGFLISSAVTIALISWYMGNRSAAQLALLSIASPIALYLIASRLLAVSLPELNVIELAYARLLGE